MKPARLKPLVLSVVTSTCLVAAPISKSLAASDALAQGQEEALKAVKYRKPRLRGVGLIVGGSLLGVVGVHAAMIGGLDWLSARAAGEGAEEMDLGDEKRGRLTFLVGAGGTLVAGVLLVSGIVLNQRYQRWKSRPVHEKLAQPRVLPSLGWNGRTRTVGLAGRF